VPGIFISYRREDTSAHAGRLYDRLAAKFANHRVFIDIDAIEPGMDFVEVINEKVGSCEVLLAVIGRSWLTLREANDARRLDNSRDLVRLEIETALRRGVRVIPVLVGGARMPTPDELPEELSGIARRQSVEISDNRFNEGVSALITVLERILGDTPQRATSSHSGDQLGPGSRRHRFLPTRRVAIAAGVVAVLSLAAAVYYTLTTQVFSGATTSVAELRRSVVKISSESPDGRRRTGAGVVVKGKPGDLYVLTAAYVVEGDPRPRFTFAETPNTATVARVVNIEGDDVGGFALLAVSETPPPSSVALSMKPSQELEVGDDVVVIGFSAAGGDWAVIRGNFVSRRGRTLTFSAAIDEGFSGGPVISGGRLVGLVTGMRGGFTQAAMSESIQTYLGSFAIRGNP
jgi:hypothetical protein